VYDQITLAKGSSQYYTIYFPPCSNLVVLAFPLSGSASLYMAQNRLYPMNSGFQWSGGVGTNVPVLQGFCCGGGNPAFDGNTPLRINVFAYTDLTVQLFVYDMSQFLPASYFYQLGKSVCSYG
jgi:hypothetical protein